MNPFLKVGESLFQSLLGMGPTRVEEWQAAADAFAGTYVRGSFTRSDRLVVPTEGGRVVVDLFSRQATPVTTFTRFQLGYRSQTDFVFSARHTSTQDAIAQVFGRGKDIEIGEPLFDLSFAVSASDAEKVKLLLADTGIRSRIPRRPGITLMSSLPTRWVPSLPPRRSTAPPDFRVLSCWALEVVRDQAAVGEFIDLLRVTIARLREIGEATADIPEIDPD